MPDIYIKNSQLSVSEVIEKFKQAVTDNQFGILHVFDIKQTLADKGQELAEECHIFEVCNPKVAKDILEKDVNLAIMLPCRISVYTQDNVTKVGLALPFRQIAQLSNINRLLPLVEPVEKSLIKIVDQSIA
ncbi:DUF302 domain-containing protein [Candidatus Ruthia endofausta]|uniref:DUF302 domain-containing protein n=1 Tax=Candidatus Ruthia endofausta TaxID=2738852 RepID=A0A6N0HQN3_9GAMM|nr:DUF302 domain-containing protein [Candidatus Ruthia endofausta]QKQ24655.1 DUF302 domain-containing protein [Candidatus Ruthia endofausta]